MKYYVSNRKSQVTTVTLSDKDDRYITDRQK